MKNAPPGRGAARDADASLLLATENSSGIAFRVRDIECVDYGSKRATFIVELDALTIESDLFVLKDGTQFVTPASVRDRYSGVWRRVAKFDDAFAADVLDVVLALLDADADGS